MKKSVLSLVLIICIIAGCLVGCKDKASNESYDETTINVDKNGKITETIVDSFDKEYYNIDELRNAFNAEIDQYNAIVGRSAAELKDIKTENNNVYVSVSFEDMKAYKAIQNKEFFFGTIKEAYEAGYRFDITMKGVENGDRIEKVQIMGMSDKHIVIFNEVARISTYRPIIYVSANVDVLKDKTARSSSESGSGLCYIVLDK